MTEEKAVKPPKGKKRPSDFEIVRTILQRTSERKLPYLLKNMGEDSDILFLCSEAEDEFKYGSSDLSIIMIEVLDPELKDMFQGCLSKLHGLRTEYSHPLLINIRDQISELAKNKGQSIDIEVESDEYGSVWNVRKDVRGQERVVYFSRAVDSLFHFQAIQGWCSKYRHLLSTVDPAHIYYNYAHPTSETSQVVSFPPAEQEDHPLRRLYPFGFRSLLTRGIDVAIGKSYEGHFPFPIEREEMIFFADGPMVAQMAHRITGQGWRMIILRPNAMFFPSHSTPLVATGSLEL